MARTDAEQVTYLDQCLSQCDERANSLFNRNINLADNNARLRTELDIVKGWIGCFGDEQRKTLNAEWVLGRIAACLEITAD